MNLKYIVLSVFISSAFWGKAQAQSIDDAIIISREDNPGSARIKGMGNVQTAIGGDISSINGNPAGLGFYTKSDVNITFDRLGSKNKTNYFGTNNTSNKVNFGIDQAGAVFNFPTFNRSGWQNFNVGVSYNKTQNFNNTLIYDGKNNTSTIVNSLTDIMANNPNSGFTKSFAGSGMVDKFGNEKDGYFPLAVENESKDQYNEVYTRGNKSKSALSFGSNYNNQLYVGASIGITSFNYEKSTKFIENGYTKTPDEIKADNPNSTFADPNHADYKFADASYELFDNFRQVTSGTGIDFKIGAIYKPASDWNIGVTITSPTWMTIQDDTRTFTDIDYYDNATAAKPFHTYESKFDDSELDFNLTTPWKFSLGLTKLFSRGLISADVEYVTYNTMRYSSSDGYPSNNLSRINKDIKNTYQGVANVRVGAEYLFTNIISGRAGFNYFGNPYKNTSDTNYSGSLGLGVKVTNSIYLDFAVVHQVQEYKEAPYTMSDFWLNKGLTNPVANIKNQRTSGILTIGAKF